MNVQDFSAGEPLYSLDEAVGMIRKAVEEGRRRMNGTARKGGELFWTEVSLTASHIGGEDVSGCYPRYHRPQGIEKRSST